MANYPSVIRKKEKLVPKIKIAKTIKIEEAFIVGVKEVRLKPHQSYVYVKGLKKVKKEPLKRQDGSRCSTNDECNSGDCGGDLFKKTCQAKKENLADGAKCSKSTQCKSRKCSWGKCEAKKSKKSSKKKYRLSIGKSCTRDTQCSTGFVRVNQEKMC